jgi:hypothetical protein
MLKRHNIYEMTISYRGQRATLRVEAADSYAACAEAKRQAIRDVFDSRYFHVESGRCVESYVTV